MDKLRMRSLDGVQDNIQKIGALFPECVTEVMGADGAVTRKIDFEKLQQNLSDSIVEGREERYQFTWPDKKKAILLANAPVSATLRPCREESVDFDTTQNLYIEGDNLDVLKCLKETYLHKVKMIYIDPPYNTGNDFVYEDDFAESAEEYRDRSGQYDDQGNRLVANTESNGRFHTDWLNMIYPRLKVARDLLSDDGVIFISIDDNEAKNLKNICDEIYGESNFLAQVVWERAFAPINLMKHFSPSHDYILVYARNSEIALCKGIKRGCEADDRYSNPDNDPRGVWQSDNLSVGPAVESNIYPITTPSGRVVEPPAGRSWRLSAKAFAERLADNRIWFGSDGNGVPRMKRFLSELRKNGITPMTLWKYTEVGHSQDATKALAKLFDGKKYFDYPKPVELIKRCIGLYSDADSIVLDFFSGSATTAHALMELNAEDGGNRKFILVQLPEATGEKSDAYKAGYNNICDIAKERIRRAGAKIKQSTIKQCTMNNVHCTIKDEQPDLFDATDSGGAASNIVHSTMNNVHSLDIGFRVLKLDSSNMHDVYYSPAETDQGDLFSLVDNVKDDRTGEDLLFQAMLELGATLDSKIETTEIGGKTVYNVAEGYLVATFDKDVTDEVVTAIAKMQPLYAVMRDTSMADDSTATNFEQIFKSYSPNTTIKVI